MSEPYIGEIRLVGFYFAPLGWAHCDGQLLSIAEYEALFTLIGTTYGGDGQVNFALPDLRGRLPVHRSTSIPSLPLATSAGQENVTLVTTQNPAHTHTVLANQNMGEGSSPLGGVWAATGQGQFAAPPPTTILNPASIQPAGGSQPHDNMMPFQVVSFIIALEGIYPSQA